MEIGADPEAGTLTIKARRVFTEDPSDLEGMCRTHRERSSALHESLAHVDVLDWAATDDPCGDKEPPVNVAVLVRLETVETFTELVRRLAASVESKRIAGAAFRARGSDSSAQISGVVLSDFPGVPVSSVDLAALSDDQLSELFGPLHAAIQ